MDVIKKPSSREVRLKVTCEFDIEHLPFELVTQNIQGNRNKTTFYQYLSEEDWIDIKKFNPTKLEKLDYLSRNLSHTQVTESFCEDAEIPVQSLHDFSPYHLIDFECIDYSVRYQ